MPLDLKMLGFHEGTLAFVIALIGLPYLYFSMSTAIHRSYADVLKERGRLCDRVRPSEFAVSEEALFEIIEEQLSVFEMEWWSIAAVGILMLILFNLDWTLSILGNPASCTTQGHLGAVVGNGPSDLDFDLCIGRLHLASISGAVRTYALVVALIFAGRFAWAQVAATRHLKYVYALALAKSQ